MIRNLLTLACLLGAIPAVGCAMCDRCDDYNYGAYGGIRPRDDMEYGRVGSIIAPADGVPSGIVEEEGPVEMAPQPDPQPHTTHESYPDRSARRPAQRGWQPY